MRFGINKDQLKQIIGFLFKSLFVFWLVLSVLELLMPGFAIRYLNLNYILLVAGLLFFLDLIL